MRIFGKVGSCVLSALAVIAARADVPSLAAYAQRGLAAQWDGIVKAADETTTWTDLVGGLSFSLTDGCEVKDDRVHFPGSATYGRTSSTDALALFRKLGAKGTLEILEHTANGGKVAALQGVGGVAIGSFGGVNLINCNTKCNAREFNWAGTTNTIAVQYSSGNCGDAYANGRLLNVLSYSENFSGGSSSVILGNRENMENPFYGSIYAVRVYTNQLTAAEIGRNAAVDRMRYLGASEDEAGFRWNAATETGTSRIAVTTPGVGQIRLNGAAVSSGAADWYDDGAVVTVEYVPDGKVSETGAWQDVPGDATVSEDGRTVSFTAFGPVTLVYAISEVETDDLIANDATMRRIETSEGVSYVFTNGSASVTLKGDRTMTRALVVGGGGAGGGANGSGGVGGQVILCGKRVIQAASVLSVGAGAGGLANGASAGKAGGASSLAVPGATFSATGGTGGAAKGNAAGAGAGVESDITGVTRLYGKGGAAKGSEPAEPGADGLGAGGDGGATGAKGGAGAVTLTLTDSVAGGQPEIVEGSVRISFQDGIAVPCGTMTLGGKAGAIYAAKVLLELGVNDGPTLSSNVVEGAVLGNTINCDGTFFALPTDTVWLRVTVSAADAETRTANVSAPSEGVCPNCAYIPASAYVQRGLVACWDGGENAGAGQHLNETDRWTDLSGTYSFALTDTTVGLDGMTFGKGSSVGIMSSVDAQATFGKVKPGTAEVVEYTAYDPSGTRSVVISSGMGPGVLIGQYGGNVLANVAREDSYAFNWRGTTNTVSVAYDADRHTTAAWANAAPLGKGSSTDNTSVKSDGTVGNRTTKDAPFRGAVYCIRLYSAVLTDDELALNRAIDRVRFGQTPAAEAGLRWNREIGQLEGRVRCLTNGRGTFTFKDLESSDATSWQAIGETVTAVYHPSEDDDRPVGWVNLPADAVVSADGFSVTLPVKDATDISFAVAKTLRVTPDADDETGTGETWASPVSLPRALELAAGAGRILCKAGRYDITAPLAVRGTVSVEGGFVGTDDVTLAAEPVSVLDAQGRSAVAEVMSVTSETGSGNVLKRLCFRGGYKHGLNKTGSAPLAVYDCRFEANGATAAETDVNQIYGRGLCCTGTGTETLVVSNCVFAGNVKTIIGGYAGYGFALAVRNLARVVVDDTLFITNGFNYAAPPRGQTLGKSGCGGTAIYALNTPITARRCRFVANHGMCYDEAVAGGIVRLAGAGGGSSFENCVWSGNEEPCGSSGNGAGAVIGNGISGMLSVSFDTSGATCDVVGCTFAYNLSDAWFAPAAVHLLKGTMTLRNSIVFGNFTSTGCRVGRDVYVRAAGSLSVDHTLFGSDAADRIVAADGATLTLGEGVKYGDPLFVTPFADVQPLATIAGGPGSNFKYDAATRAALTAFNVHLRGGSGYRDERTGRIVRAYCSKRLRQSSPAIDAGKGDCAGEPEPNGQRVNLGFYGNTPWATLSAEGTLLIVR